MKTYIWIGPEGFNPKLGAVSHGKKLDLDDKESEFFLDRKLIKLETPKLKNKER